MNKNTRNAIFTGLALFASYFGAGNLIFPPMLGLESGTNWVPSIIGLTLSGIFLPILGMIVISYAGGTVDDLTRPVSKNCYNILVGGIMVFATFVSIPRTAAVAAELGVQGIFPSTPFLPVIIIYFILCVFFSSNKDNVIDRIGVFLTPALTIILVLIVIKGFISPVGTPVDTPLANPFTHSFLGGYQTGDVLVSFLLANVFIGTIINKGYTSAKERNAMTIKAGIIAFICLFVVYGGLLYLGATGGGYFNPDIERAELLSGLVRMVGGSLAVNGLGLAVILACLTTAVSQVSAASDYFVTLSKDKLNYKITVIVVACISLSVASMGVDRIVAFSTPLFLLMYPTCIVLVLLGVIRKFVPNDGAYKGTVLLTLIFSILEAIQSTPFNFALNDAIVAAMPFSGDGLGWLAPAIVGFIGGTVIYMSKGKSAGKTVN